MTAAQLFGKYVNLTLMLTDSFYWLGIYQIELAGLHDWSMCSLILRVVRCEVSGVYLIWISGGYWLTVVNISQHKPKPSPTYRCGRWKDGKIDLHQQTKKKDPRFSYFQQIISVWQEVIHLHWWLLVGCRRTHRRITECWCNFKCQTI